VANYSIASNLYAAKKQIFANKKIKVKSRLYVYISTRQFENILSNIKQKICRLSLLHSLEILMYIIFVPNMDSFLWEDWRGEEGGGRREGGGGRGEEGGGRRWGGGAGCTIACFHGGGGWLDPSSLPSSLLLLHIPISRRHLMLQAGWRWSYATWSLVSLN
jgi:hypothetical protein